MMTDQNDIRDHSYLIRQIHEFLYKHQSLFKKYPLPDIGETDKFQYGTVEGNNIILSEETGVELGTPGSESYFHVLWQQQAGLVENNLYIASVDFQNLKKSKEFLLYVMLEINSYNLFKDKVVQSKNISKKLDRIMVKGLRDRIWFRISKDLSEKGFDFYSLGQAVSRNFFEHNPDIAHLDIVIAADNPDIIGFFRSIHHTIGIIEGNNRKLKWVEDGVISCDDLNCNTCDEKPGCDIIKDIVVKKKREVQ